MANESSPFNEEMLTLIMGVDPNDPGQHGRTLAPRPDKDAIGVISQIKDLCEEFLMRAGKDDDSQKDESEETTEEEEE